MKYRIEEFLNECRHNKNVNLLKDLENRVDLDYVIERLEYILEDNFRICTHCGKTMKEGYCIENGMEYYCSDDCLHKVYTEEEYLELYDDGNGDSYWTSWEV